MAKPKLQVSEKENIRRLYLEEKLGTKPIGEIYGVGEDVSLISYEDTTSRLEISMRRIS